MLREGRLAFLVESSFCWEVKTRFGKQTFPVEKQGLFYSSGFTYPAGGDAGIKATTRGFFQWQKPVLAAVLCWQCPPHGLTGPAELLCL